MATTEERIRKIVRENFDGHEDLGKASNTDVAEMIMSIEEEFDIAIADEFVFRAKSIGEIIAYVKNKLGEAKKED